jgi:hypothetical protein
MLLRRFGQQRGQQVRPRLVGPHPLAEDRRMELFS